MLLQSPKSWATCLHLWYTKWPKGRVLSGYLWPAMRRGFSAPSMTFEICGGWPPASHAPQTRVPSATMSRTRGDFRHSTVNSSGFARPRQRHAVLCNVCSHASDSAAARDLLRRAVEWLASLGDHFIVHRRLPPPPGDNLGEWLASGRLRLADEAALDPVTTTRTRAGGRYVDYALTRGVVAMRRVSEPGPADHDITCKLDNVCTSAGWRRPAVRALAEAEVTDEAWQQWAGSAAAFEDATWPWCRTPRSAGCAAWTARSATGRPGPWTSPRAPRCKCAKAVRGRRTLTSPGRGHGEPRGARHPRGRGGPLGPTGPATPRRLVDARHAHRRRTAQEVGQGSGSSPRSVTGGARHAQRPRRPCSNTVGPSLVPRGRGHQRGHRAVPQRPPAAS